MVDTSRRRALPGSQSRATATGVQFSLSGRHRGEQRTVSRELRHQFNQGGNTANETSRPLPYCSSPQGQVPSCAGQFQCLHSKHTEDTARLAQRSKWPFVVQGSHGRQRQRAGHNPSVEPRPNGRPPGPPVGVVYHPPVGPGVLPPVPSHLER